VKRDDRLGLAFAGYCIANTAIVPAVAKLTTAEASGLFIALSASSFAADCAVGLLAWHRELRLLFARKTLPTLLAVGTLGTAAAFVLFFEGAKRATAIETAVCVQTEPLYALFGSWLFLGHALTLRRVLALAVILAGIFLVIGARGLSGSLGVGLLLLTPLAWQSSHWVALRNLGQVNPRLLSAARYLYGTLVLLPVWLMREGPSTLPAAAELWRVAPVLVVQGLFLSFIGTLAWYSAVRRLDLTRTTALVVPSGPLLSLAVSYLVLGEVVTPWQAVGFALTASGVLAFALAPSAVVEQTAEHG
jgi:drug/metabolite transporter (DMT)-like permease